MKYVMGALKAQSIVNYAIRKRYLRRRLRGRDTPQLMPLARQHDRPRLCNYAAAGAQFGCTCTRRMTVNKTGRERFGAGE